MYSLLTASSLFVKSLRMRKLLGTPSTIAGDPSSTELRGPSAQFDLGEMHEKKRERITTDDANVNKDTTNDRVP